MDVFREYATDEKKENEGVWVPFGGDAKLLIARAGNRKYARMLAREVEKHQRTLDLKTEAADELSDSIMIDVLAQTVLLGWENVSFKGEQLSYTKDNARLVLAVKEFRQQVTRLASDFDTYRLAHEATALGN